ncbi:MAG: guanylate kinase [Rickettsiales bacterium]|nr:guanylate kinase [Rickettsiales bacterium]
MDFKSLKRRGFMLVLSSPSGAGKTTITREVLKRDRKISLSVSATTREQRPGEEDGVHYHFKSQEEFKKMRENDELLEAANVFGNWYGTPKKAVTEALEKGGDVMFDIDWQGSQQLKENAIDDVITIFILPPSRSELENRLRSRAQDTDRVIEDRMQKANSEISHYTEYDFIVINEDLETSVDKVMSIIKSERLKRRRLTGLNAFVRDLMNQAN